MPTRGMSVGEPELVAEVDGPAPGRRTAPGSPRALSARTPPCSTIRSRSASDPTTTAEAKRPISRWSKPRTGGRAAFVVRAVLVRDDHLDPRRAAPGGWPRRWSRTYGSAATSIRARRSTTASRRNGREVEPAGAPEREPRHACLLELVDQPPAGRRVAAIVTSKRSRGSAVASVTASRSAPPGSSRGSIRTSTRRGVTPGDGSSVGRRSRAAPGRGRAASRAACCIGRRRRRRPPAAPSGRRTRPARSASMR